MARNRLTGTWMMTMPSSAFGTALTAQEFQDNLRLRYGITPAGLPNFCVCGEAFTVAHALCCKQGGLVVQRHDAYSAEARKLITAALTPSAVHSEPLIYTSCDPVEGGANEVDGEARPEIRGDISAYGFWAPQRTVIFDVRVVCLNRPGANLRQPDSVLKSNEAEKKLKYCSPCHETNRSFTPLVVSADGVMGPEHQKMVRRLAGLLSEKWERNYSEVMTFVKARLAFGLARSMSRCLRAERDRKP